MLRAIFLIVASLMLVGCGGNPTAETIASAHYGQYPSNYKESIHAYMTSVAFDPGSLQYRNWTTPKKTYNGFFDSVVYGYTVCVDVNAKNRMGGYVGFDTHDFLIRNGRIMDSTDFRYWCDKNKVPH